MKRPGEVRSTHSLSSWDEVRFRLSASFLLRRHVRTQLELSGVEYWERRGLLSSDFYITATPDTARAIDEWIDRVNAA